MEGNNSVTAYTVLLQAAATFKVKDAEYGSNSKMVGPVMAALFPEGVKLETPEDFELWHLFELAIVKLTRFVCSDFSHTDSAHDAAVYWAMIESIVRNRADATAAEILGEKR